MDSSTSSKFASMHYDSTIEDVAADNCHVTAKPIEPSRNEKEALKHLEQVQTEGNNLVYDNVDEEPELHARTYIAVGTIFILQIVQVIALQGPPAVLSYIGEDLNNTTGETWIANSLALVQTVLGPIASSVADTFQLRKSLIVGSCVIAFIGAAIAPGSSNIYRLIGAQILIGVGFATIPLQYCVPSEILPRKWRPMAQAAVNLGASLGAVAGPLTIGALTKASRLEGWRTFYWIQMGLWGAVSIGIIIGYRPPKRHTRYDHLSFWQKVGKLDLIGSFLLTFGLTLLLTGLNLGGGLYTWTNARVLTTLVLGSVGLITFFFYEWKATKTGILHHDLFKEREHGGRRFAISLILIGIEGILLYSFIVFYPIFTVSLFETDPLLLVLRSTPFWIAGGISTVIWGYSSTKLKRVREPLSLGFLFLTAGIVGMATTQPSRSTALVVFAGLAGLGFGAPLVLIVTIVQLSTPHHLIATATAVTTSARGLGSTIFTAIFTAAYSDRLAKDLPNYISKAALSAGLPTTSLRAFVEALAGGDTTALPKIAGVTPAIIAAGISALKQAYADSIRVVFIIAAPFGLVACLVTLFLGDVRKTMNYRVDAPMEDLHAKAHHHQSGQHEVAEAE